jgi:hypothetical protein
MTARACVPVYVPEGHCISSAADQPDRSTLHHNMKACEARLRARNADLQGVTSYGPITIGRFITHRGLAACSRCEQFDSDPLLGGGTCFEPSCVTWTK